MERFPVHKSKNELITEEDLLSIEDFLFNLHYRSKSLLDKLALVSFKCDCGSRYIIYGPPHTIECECGKKWRTSTDRCIKEI